MHADINGSLNQFNKSWKWFEHNGVKMTKQEVWNVLNYAKEKGYSTTAYLSDEEIEREKSITKTPAPCH